MSPPKIAIWAETGTDFTLFKVLPKMGFRLNYLYKKDVDSLSTENFDVIILPPGSGLDLAKSLGENGCRKIESFIRSGGGYLGVCAGAYLPVKGYLQETSWLEIVNAKVRNWPVWSLGRGIVVLETINPNNPIMYGFNGSFRVIYWNGPVLEPYTLNIGEASNIVPLAYYVKVFDRENCYNAEDIGNNILYVNNVFKKGLAITYSTFGKGRVVLIGPHPEIVDASKEASNAILRNRYNWRIYFNTLYYISPKSKFVILKYKGI